VNACWPRDRASYERTCPRQLSLRRRAPRPREPELALEARVPQRAVLHLRHGVARDLGLSSLRRRLTDPGQRPRQHPDRVDVAQQYGALAKEPQRRPDPSARQPDQAERRRLDRRGLCRPPREREVVAFARQLGRLDEPAGEPQRGRALHQQDRLGQRQLVAVPAGDRLPRLGDGDRLAEATA
jgi:hypothetical protein